MITFPMTRRRFEDICKVPNGERLTGRGWIASFCRTYKLKECHRHGEAGSVDPLEVEAEREQIQLILAVYQPKDCWNVDDSSVKAHYHHAFCLHAVELDEADEPNIYGIDLLEAMTMVKEAWDAVSTDTIRNCWRHAGIQSYEKVLIILARYSWDD